MNIFLSFPGSEKKYPIPAYDFWQHYIKNGITEAGHTWQECPGADWALGLVPKTPAEQSKWKEDIWGKTLNWLKKNPADIFLSYLYPEQIGISAINEIRKSGIPCVNFFCDNIRLFTKAPAQFSVFDLNWVPEYNAVDFYKKAGYPYINLPMPMWVDPQLRHQQPEINGQVTFIGSKDIQRQLLFEDIIKISPDMPLMICGNGWDGKVSQFEAIPGAKAFLKKAAYQYRFIKNNGPAAYRRKLNQRKMNTGISNELRSRLSGNINSEVYTRITAGSMITVGVNRYPSFRYPLLQPGTYSRLRDIEAPMLGACYLTEYTPGLEELYDIGNEIEAYHDAASFIEKVNELTADKQKRGILKSMGQKRALQDHSIPQSVNKILKRLTS